MRVACVIPARNEEAYIANTLRALNEQEPLTIASDEITPEPAVDPIILVDDGSTDSTVQIAAELGARVVAGPSHHHKIRTLRICETINKGLAEVPPDADYVLILGADNLIQPGYCRELIGRMESDSRLVVASGRCRGERWNPRIPRGTRIVDYRWWVSEGEPPGLYGVDHGWEDRLLHWAWWKGYETRSFQDIVTEPQRRSGREADWEERGQAMRVLGYDLLRLIWRSLGLVLMDGNITGAGDMVRGYLHTGLRPEPWARAVQKRVAREGIHRGLRGHWPLGTSDLSDA